MRIYRRFLVAVGQLVALYRVALAGLVLSQIALVIFRRMTGHQWTTFAKKPQGQNLLTRQGHHHIQTTAK
jgi:hypothetical protein